jgi:hypothetical protein
MILYDPLHFSLTNEGNNTYRFEAKTLTYDGDICHNYYMCKEDIDNLIDMLSLYRDL